MKRTARLLLLLLATAPAPGCVSANYSSDAVDEPIAPATIAALRPGHDTLTTCLAALGAPNRVTEYLAAPDGKAGAVLLWYWQATAGWGVKGSGGRKGPGSLAIDMTIANLPGCMLWFGPDLVLERVHAGKVGELDQRVRPASIDG